MAHGPPEGPALEREDVARRDRGRPDSVELVRVDDVLGHLVEGEDPPQVRREPGVVDAAPLGQDGLRLERVLPRLAGVLELVPPPLGGPPDRARSGGAERPLADADAEGRRVAGRDAV
eukprot:1200043-Alexandrium_andersonii.AAC.1